MKVQAYWHEVTGDTSVRECSEARTALMNVLNVDDSESQIRFYNWALEKLELSKQKIHEEIQRLEERNSYD